MENGNPTGDGASTLDRIESFLAVQEGDEPKREEPQVEDQSEETPETPETTDEPESDVEGESEGPQLTTSDLAKLLGADESIFDVDDDGNVVFKTKIDGKEGAAKFNDMLKTYQLQGHVDNRLREAAEQHKAIQQRALEADQQANARMQQVDDMARLAGSELLAEYQSIDWQTLRQIDPGEYAAKQADFQTRNQKIQSVLQQTNQQRQYQSQQQQYQFQQFLEHQRQMLPQVLPEWADHAVAAKEKAEIKQWGVQAGIDPQFLDTVASAHLVKVLRNAMLYEKWQAKNIETEKKVRSAPKLVRPGQSVDAKSRAGESLRNIKSKISKSGGKSGVMEYLLATGKV